MTVTWIQLNSQLLRLTGEAKYGDELERSYYNHLAGAQRPDGAEWCYYTPLEGTKPYGPGINCCVSSGPRGMALAPQLTFLKRGRNTIVINLFESATYKTEIGGQTVEIEQRTDFPKTAAGALLVRSSRPVRLNFQIRSPWWTANSNVEGPGLPGAGIGKVNESAQGVPHLAAWLNGPVHTWKSGGKVSYVHDLTAYVTRGSHSNAGRVAAMWGPIVLAYDEARNSGAPPARAITAGSEQIRRIEGESLAFAIDAKGPSDSDSRSATLVPFYDAGSSGGRYAVWLRAPGSKWPTNESLFGFGEETRSREGNQAGSICDGDPGTYVVTFDSRPRPEDWFSVTSEKPQSVKRIVYLHGHSFHDGGWFDASAGKPRIQIQRQKGGPWETVGELAEYPATSNVDSAGLKDGQPFTLRLSEPIRVFGIRVIGKPASGDNPAQSFTSCAELQAYTD